MTGSNLHLLLLTVLLFAIGEAAVASNFDDAFPSTTWLQMRDAYPAQIAAACAAVRTRAAELSSSPSTRAMGDSVTRAACECMPMKTDRLLSDLAAQEPAKRVSAERRAAFGASALDQCRDAESSPSVAMPSGDQGKIEAIRIGFVAGCLISVVSRELTRPGPERMAADLLVDSKCNCFAPEMDRNLRALVASSNGGPIASNDVFIAVRRPTQTCGARMIRGMASLCGVMPDRSLVGIDQPAYCSCLSEGLRKLSDEDLLPTSSFSAPGEVARPRPASKAFNNLQTSCRAGAAPVGAASPPR